MVEKVGHVSGYVSWERGATEEVMVVVATLGVMQATEPVEVSEEAVGPVAVLEEELVEVMALVVERA